MNTINEAIEKIHQILSDSKRNGTFDIIKGAKNWPTYTNPWTLDDNSMLYVSQYYNSDRQSVFEVRHRTAEGIKYYMIE